MGDDPTRWRSPQWLDGATSWLRQVLARRGITTTAPLVQHHLRFWSTVLHVETDVGRVWIKENAPSQSFEAGLVSRIHRCVPGWVAEPLAVTNAGACSPPLTSVSRCGASRPLAALRIPLWAIRHSPGGGHDDTDLHGVVQAWHQAWGDLVTLEDVTRLLPAAERISCLHRAESWGRLQDDVPLHAVDERFQRSVPQWLVAATAPDPFDSAAVR